MATSLAAVVAGLTCWPSVSAATPVTYRFSVLSSFYSLAFGLGDYQPSPLPPSPDHGEFTVDVSGGTASLSFQAPLGEVLFDLTGSTSGAVSNPDPNHVFVYFDFPVPSWTWIDLGGDVPARLFGSASLFLNGPAIVSDGDLRTGLTLEDLINGYVVLPVEVTEGSVLGTFASTYCPGFTNVECANQGHDPYVSGYYTYYYFSALVPEPGQFELLALLLACIVMIRTRVFRVHSSGVI